MRRRKIDFQKICSPQPFLPSNANLAFDDTLNSTSAKREVSPGQAKEALEILTSFSLLYSDIRGKMRKSFCKYQHDEGWAYSK